MCLKVTFFFKFVQEFRIYQDDLAQFSSFAKTIFNAKKLMTIIYPEKRVTQNSLCDSNLNFFIGQ